MLACMCVWMPTVNAYSVHRFVCHFCFYLFWFHFMSKVRHRRPICKYWTMLCMLRKKNWWMCCALNQIVRIHLNECNEIAHCASLISEKYFRIVIMWTQLKEKIDHFSIVYFSLFLSSTLSLFNGFFSQLFAVGVCWKCSIVCNISQMR